jgi:hypothetical protein
MTAHWGMPDPATVEGDSAQIALPFADCYRMPNNRLSIFTSLPLASYQVHVALGFEHSHGSITAISLDDLKASATKLVGQIEPKEHLVFNYENSIFFCGFGLGLQRHF